jgi:transposase-like protein
MAVDGALFLDVGGIRKRIDSGSSHPKVYRCIVHVERNRLSKKS